MLWRTLAILAWIMILSHSLTSYDVKDVQEMEKNWRDASLKSVLFPCFLFMTTKQITHHMGLTRITKKWISINRKTMGNMRQTELLPFNLHTRWLNRHRSCDFLFIRQNNRYISGGGDPPVCLFTKNQCTLPHMIVMIAWCFAVSPDSSDLSHTIFPLFLFLLISSQCVYINILPTFSLSLSFSFMLPHPSCYPVR